MKNIIIISYFILLLLGTLFILFLINDSILSSLIIFYLVVYFGYNISNRTCLRQGHKNFRFIHIFWLIKLFLTFFLLYWSWIPGLDPNSPTFGYDPQRYYFDAYDLLQNGWNPLVSSNYQGIIFYYGLIFYAFGHNPLIPALINSFLTLSIILLLINFLLSHVNNKTRKDWYIIFLLIIPEFIWYDILTSRESILSFLIIASCLITALLFFKEISLIKAVFFLFITLGLILAIRTSLIFPSILNLFLLSIFIVERHAIFDSKKIILLIILSFLISLAPLLQSNMGGYDFDILKAFNSTQSFESNVASDDGFSWSNNSIGTLIMPTNTFEAILFTPIRMILYVLSPLPNIRISFKDLYLGNWIEWQKLFTILTSIIMVYCVPYLMSGFSYVIRNRKTEKAGLVIYITFWVYFIAICGGNLIIHERYRVMISILFFTCAWYGYTRAGNSLKYILIWFCLLLHGGLFYIFYKY